MMDLTGDCDRELALHLEGRAVKVHLVGRPSVPVRAVARRGPALALGYGGDGPQCSPAMVPLGLKAMVTTPGPWPIVTGYLLAQR